MSLFTRKPDKVVVGTARRRTRISTDSPSERVIYHRSGIPSRGGHPTDRAHRGVAAPMSYGFWLRLADNWDGWLDGRHAGDRPLADLEWAQRLQDLHEENVNRLYAATADVNYAVRTGAGPAEGHVDERIIAQRRRAEHSRAKEPVRQRLSALRDEQHEVITQALDLRAQLEEEFAVLLRIEERHRSFYQPHHLLVDAGGEVTVPVHHIGDATGHARGEVAPGPAQHHHPPAGHILAAVVAHAFHHGRARPARRSRAKPR